MSQEDTLVHAFDRDGFVLGGRVLERPQVELLADELERFIDTLFRDRNHEIRSPTYWTDASRLSGSRHLQIVDLWKVSEPFRRLIENPAIAGMAARLARASLLQIWSDTVQYKPAEKGAAFEWHQDAPYHKSTFPPTRLLAAWVALDDSDEDSGCMWMVPGSHRWGDQTFHLDRFRTRFTRDEFVAIEPPANPPRARIEWAAPVSCPVRAGEVHFHHGYTWHGSPANRSGRRRAGYTIFYMPDGVVAAVSTDPRVMVSPGTPMIDAGPNFPVVYRREVSAAAS
jgi:ectoine hydroxylase-related dioxygenase (phytanoyl-CoA dioxygenase family)